MGAIGLYLDRKKCFRSVDTERSDRLIRHEATGTAKGGMGFGEEETDDMWITISPHFSRRP